MPSHRKTWSFLRFEDIAANFGSVVSELFKPVDRQLADLGAANHASERHTNVSLSAGLIAFQRLANRFGGCTLHSFLDEAARHGFGGPPFRLSPDTARDVVAIYRRSNEMVARRFLNRGELFEEDDLHSNCSSGADYTGQLSNEFLALLLAFYIKTNNEELRRLNTLWEAALRSPAMIAAALAKDLKALSQVLQAAKGAVDDAAAALSVEDADIKLIRESGLFDPTFYALTLEAEAAGIDPIVHYVERGEARGVSPSAGFDPAFYSMRYPDVAATSMNRLLHYLRAGRREGRRPLPEKGSES